MRPAPMTHRLTSFQFHPGFPRRSRSIPSGQRVSRFRLKMQTVNLASRGLRVHVEIDARAAAKAFTADQSL